MKQIKTSKLIAIGLGLIIAVLMIVVGFKMFESVFTRAADSEPRDVIISNILQNTAKISWTTGVATQGVVEYGTSPTALNFYAPEIQSAKSHLIELTLLSPNTTYYFNIRIGDKKYDNGGVPWTFTTKSSERSIEKSSISISPTPTPALINKTTKPTPTPYQELIIPNQNSNSLPAPTVVANCPETDCQQICQKLGKGCFTSDFIKNKCVGKVNMSNCGLLVTPALTLTPTPTP
jgi:hypothetical protein